MNIKNITNEYAKSFPAYEQTPKAVIAAIAYSLAMRLTCDDFEAAERMIRDEWQALHDAGIVPQRPVLEVAA